MFASSRNRWVWGLLFWGVGVLGLAAQDDAKSFDESSLAWRTALHFDPMAEVPLESLIELYSKSGRLPELAGLYLTHLGSYPTDVSATTVLARIYVETEDSRAEAFIGDATRRFPSEAGLHRARGRWLKQKNRPGAMAAWCEAIELAADPARRDAWMLELLSASGTRASEDEAALGVLLTKLGAEPKVAVTPDEWIRWGKVALESGMVAAAGQALESIELSALTGEKWIEAGLLKARVAVADGRSGEGAALVDDLLGRLAADHWRRGEALRMRWACAETEPERQSLLEASAARWEGAQQSEAEALNHGEMLWVAGKAREAIGHLRAALSVLPNSRAIENRVLQWMDDERLDEESLAFLKDRLELDPGRLDLKKLRARRLLSLGRSKEGIAVLVAVAEQLSKGDALEEFFATSRWLRRRNLLAEAATVLEEALKRNEALWGLRRELGELLARLQRDEELAELFSVPVPTDIPLDERMETAMFLVGESLWNEARLCLEDWVQSHPAAFEGRLMLARICVLMGDEVTGRRLLEESRDRADTAARYGAWLAAARSYAEESGKEAAFFTEERGRLTPGEGEWTERDLERLVQLGAFAAEDAKVEEAGVLIEDALAQPSLDAGSRQALLLQKVRLLEVQPDRSKELEALLEELLSAEVEGAADLRVRLVLLYARADRPDLVRMELRKLRIKDCEDASLLAQLASVLGTHGLRQSLAECAEKLVRLQPEHGENWSRLVWVLVELGDEAGLRAKLRDLQAFLLTHGADGEAKMQIRDHWVSSCWREIARVLASHQTMPPLAILTPALADLDVMELTDEQKVWKQWLAAWLSGTVPETWKPGGGNWVTFPDGLAFSKSAASALLEKQKTGEGLARPSNTVTTGSDVPGNEGMEMAWGLRAEGGRGLMRWGLMEDRSTLVVQDTALELQAMNVITGKLLWTRSLQSWARGRALPPTNSNEVVITPTEWAETEQRLVLLMPSGLVCLDGVSGEPRWEVPMPRQDDQNAPGAIGAGNGRVFWWRVGEGVLDAYDVTDGRLEWSADFPELARVPVTPSNSTVAVSAGVDYAEGRVLVWGNGNAVCTERGEKVWKAAARDSDAIMPLMLKGGDDPAAEKIDRVRAAMSWTLFPLLPQSVGRTNWPRGMALSNPLGMATPAFTGVYSQSRGSTWLTWGSEGVRALNGDRFWMVDRSGVSVCHAMGIPLGSIEGRTNSARGIEVGFARGAMVMAAGSVVERLDPDGEVEVLWSQNESTNRPSSHPFPAVGLDGRVLGVATRSMLRWQDAVTGTVLWEGEWPEEIEAWEPHWKTAFDEYQSVRWSSKGVWLLNDQRVSRALDWRSVMVKGHWVVPIGPSALVCLKSADDRTKVK